MLGLLKTKKPPSFAEPRALRGYLWRSAWHLLVNRLAEAETEPIRFDLDELPGFEKFLRFARASGTSTATSAAWRSGSR